MQPQLGKTLDTTTPVGSRIIFAISVGSYLLYVFDHHAFVGLDLVCRPVDVVYGWQIQRLLLASFVHTSLLGLCLALLVCWRRFAWIEHRTGSLGFLVWFAWSSVLLHAAYCVVAVCSAPFIGSWIVNSEVHGLLPLLTANLVASVKESDSSTVWLWPLPIHVSVRSFPAVLIALSWLLHWEAHLDVILAYALASLHPIWLEEPVPVILDAVERSAAGTWLLERLQASEGFVCRPPLPSGDFLPPPVVASGFGPGPVLPPVLPPAAPAAAAVPPSVAAAPPAKAVSGGGSVCDGPSLSAASTSVGSVPGAGSPSCHQIHDDDEEEAPASQLLTDEHDLTDQYNQQWC